VFAVENVHRQVGGFGGHPERVVALGQTDQEARWMDAGLAGEPDQTAGRDAAGCRGDDEHRIVQQRHQLLECVTAGIGHLLSVPVQVAGESHCRNLVARSAKTVRRATPCRKRVSHLTRVNPTKGRK